MPPEKDPSKIRASYKGQLTSFSSYVSKLDAETMDSSSVSELQLRLNKMKSMFERFDDVQLALECESEDMQAQLKERMEFESYYFNVVSRSQNLVDQFNKKDVEDKFFSNRSQSGHIVKLPTIQLPKFCGSYEAWLEFHDTFTALIHENSDIDDINKFHYLRSSLEGSAAIVIKSIEFSAKNYGVAWRLLCDRFDNKRLLIQNHVSALFNVESVTKESSASLKRLIDQINKNLRALESLGESVNSWDTLLIYIFTQKLDQKTFREWEEFKGRLNKNNKIDFVTFEAFLRNQADLLETLELTRNPANQNQSNQQSKGNFRVKSMVSVQSSDSKSCPKCNSDHLLTNCPPFLSLSNNDRLSLLPSFKVCFNCFSPGHYANRCKKGGCRVCKRKHNTLIHIDDFKSQQPNKNNSSSNVRSASTSTARQALSAAANGDTVALSVRVLSCNKNISDVLLSTALIKVYDSQNKEHIARAILDSGSTSCLITQRLFDRLDIPVTKINKSIMGINRISSQISKMCNLSMKSLNETYSSNIQCFVLPSITDNVPPQQVNLSDLKIPSEICLADPYFDSPAEVDLIIGADVFWDTLGSQKIILGEGKPILYETRLGWLVSGPICGTNNSTSQKLICNFVKMNTTHNDNPIDSSDTHFDLNRFWQLEEVQPQLSNWSPEERSCEEHFIKNTTRLDDGRFCVKIPLKESPQVLGDSFKKSERCFLSLEHRFENNPNLGNMYKSFMAEYESMGHMTKCDSVYPDNVNHYIPHHGVLRESSTTTKLRAVFNASSLTTSGVSFNDIQMVGPTVQDDLLSILLRFRQHKYIIAADVEKMYRQVVVHPEFRQLQQIVWRFDPKEPLAVYKLNTVTYGTASAPYLATRCLKQIGLDCKDDQIKEIITRDFYVDDLLTGQDSINEVRRIREQVTAELASACMPLRKWKSNHPCLASESSQSPVDLNIGATESSKTLGLNWQTNSDELSFPIGSSIKRGNTKRDLLSVISQIFDPLGLLSPCIIGMKILMQKLWFHKLGWDDPLPSDVQETWDEILDTLDNLNHIRVPRHVVCDLHEFVEFHIFSDASEKAYGACLYVRSGNHKGEILVRLLLAKSRVAPIKPTTIPRLELCGALVGARLYEKALSSLRLKVNSITFWTDSTIVLGWLRMMPNKLQPFVRNRVAEILEKAGNCNWRHVPTNENPADLISRGVSINSLQSLEGWWSGPNFLQKDPIYWPTQNGDKINKEDLPEVRPEKSFSAVVFQTSEEGKLIDFNRFSSFIKLKRTAAYALRFIKACKKQSFSSDFLSEEELKQGVNLIIRLSQRESFKEYDLLLNNKPLPRKSPLQKLHVFMDHDNIMRVGGRLDNSNFSYEKKHPVIIQSTHRFSRLLFDFEHKRLLHAGPQLLLYSIRENYWPLGGQRLAKATFRKCILCVRIQGRTVSPLMGNLPPNRIKPSFPFENVGVDYAGPISAVSRQGRGCKVIKVYIVVFVCFSTKALHLELVGDLTSNNYLLAIRRFISRRGKPLNIYSDNGTSFVGAYNELSKFLKHNCNSFSEDLANESIKFHFIPAYSPHFGGLWEAGVKSTKFHLVRVLGHCNLTYEELNSTLIQIEAILNSRPLTPISSDPEDLMPLTPSHFLIGRPLTSLPSPNYSQHSINHLTRHQRIEQLRQHFWTRWSKEYISQLQQRVKWKKDQNPLKNDTLVVIKDDNLPPLKWRLGRIVAVHPGSDGINRVADIRTSSGVVRRSFSRICPLPEVDVDVERDAFNAGSMFRL